MQRPLLTKEHVLTAVVLFFGAVGLFVSFWGLKWGAFAVSAVLATAYLALILLFGHKKRVSAREERETIERFVKAVNAHPPKQAPPAAAPPAEEETISLDEFRRRRRAQVSAPPDDDDPNGKLGA